MAPPQDAGLHDTRAVDAIIELEVDASGKATPLVILQGANVITATRSP